MAIAIPAILPTPTRDAVLIQKAWNEETFFSGSFISGRIYNKIEHSFKMSKLYGLCFESKIKTCTDKQNYDYRRPKEIVNHSNKAV